MFTGLIAGLGEIRQIKNSSVECRYIISPLIKLDNLKDGESIAINGVCLSIEQHSLTEFIVYASNETLSKTNLSELKIGQKVNLERALEVGQRLDGHIVTGHIDCLAILMSKTNIGSSIKLRLKFPEKYANQVIPKGSIALNGISLTINACNANWLEVNIIPDSQKRTNLPFWNIGSAINMETDIIGKYVQKMLLPCDKTQEITTDSTFMLLSKNGFI